MVQHAKQVAANINDPVAASQWREANKNLLNAVRGVRGAIVTPPEVPLLPDLAALNLKQQGGRTRVFTIISYLILNLSLSLQRTNSTASSTSI